VGTEYSCSVRFARPIYTRGGSAELLKIRDMQTPEGGSVQDMVTVGVEEAAARLQG
jgi:hypothetical protein